jgi:hypothetical protein
MHHRPDAGERRAQRRRMTHVGELRLTAVFAERINLPRRTHDAADRNTVIAQTMDQRPAHKPPGSGDGHGTRRSAGDGHAES